MNNFKKYSILFFSFCLVLFLSNLSAEPMHHGEGMHHAKGHHKPGMHAGSGQMSGKPHSGHGEKGKKSHMFTPHWAKTLTDEQKIDIDEMHLAVGQFEAVNKAKMKLLKAELNVLAAKSPSDKKAIYAKIDEIMEVKKAIKRNRYDHIVEMRQTLNKQQRISYDADLLKRKKHKH